MLAILSETFWDTFTQWSGWKWDGWTAVAAIGTLLAVAAALIIAVWGPGLGGIFFKPKLKVSIDMRPPDCFKMMETNSYWCRLRVANDGNREATDVEIQLLRLWRVEHGRQIEDHDFLPLNLIWADIEVATMPRIQPRLFKHCALCSTTNVGSTNLLLDFRTSVIPKQLRNNVWPSRKPPGHYILNLVASANNAKPVYHSLAIKFAQWFDDEGEMFSKGLVIKIEK